MQQTLLAAGAQRRRDDAGEPLLVGEVIIARPAHAHAAIGRYAHRKVGKTGGRVRPVELQGVGGYGGDHLYGFPLEIRVRGVQQHAEDRAEDHEHDRHIDADKPQPELFQHEEATSR